MGSGWVGTWGSCRPNPPPRGPSSPRPRILGPRDNRRRTGKLVDQREGFQMELVKSRSRKKFPRRHLRQDPRGW